MMDDSQTAFAQYPQYGFDLDMMKVRPSRPISRLTPVLPIHTPHDTTATPVCRMQGLHKASAWLQRTRALICRC